MNKRCPFRYWTIFNATSLSFLIHDDGSLKRYFQKYKTKKPGYYFESLILCTYSLSLSLSGSIRLQLALTKLFKLNFTLQRSHYNNKHAYHYVLRLNKKEATYFKQIIKPFVIDSLKYKLLF